MGFQSPCWVSADALKPPNTPNQWLSNTASRTCLLHLLFMLLHSSFLPNQNKYPRCQPCNCMIYAMIHIASRMICFMVNITLLPLDTAIYIKWPLLSCPLTTVPPALTVMNPFVFQMPILCTSPQTHTNTHTLYFKIPIHFNTCSREIWTSEFRQFAPQLL